MIAVVVILAFVLNLLVLQDRSSTTLVAIADRPLTAGSSLDPSTFRLVPVDSGFEGLGDLLTEDELADLEGSVFARSIDEGGLIDDSSVVAAGASSGLRSMSLPVPIEHAAGGALVVGDRVDVISVADGVASYVADDLEVISVSDGSTGSIGTVSSFHVIVNVTADDALALAEAIDAGSIEIVRSTGSDALGEGESDDT